MNKKDKEDQIKYSEMEVGEDATQYGEFISSYFAWVSLPEQKEKVDRLQDITKSKNNKKDSNS